MPGQGPIPTKEPTQKRIDVRGAVFALDGPEKPYDVYRFSDRRIYEKPQHNPFSGL
jgi:hypothetical protein